MIIGVIGNGFIGSALIAGFSLHFENILIYDVDKSRCQNSLEDVAKKCDVVFVSVPTPMSRNGKCDLSILNGLFDEYIKLERKLEQVLVVRSTIVPGTMEALLIRHPDLSFVFNPEFLTERRANLDFINSSRVVLGSDRSAALAKVMRVYRERFPFKKIVLTDFASAQMIKYVANCFFATKVSFMNEMKQISDACGADWHHVLEGFITDGRIGNSHIDVPGHDGSLGFGGKCVKGARKVKTNKGEISFADLSQMTAEELESISVLSSTHDQAELNWKNIIDITKRDYVGEMISISFETPDGEHIFECTPDHLLPVVRQGTLGMIQAKFVKETDEVFWVGE